MSAFNSSTLAGFGIADGRLYRLIEPGDAVSYARNVVVGHTGNAVASDLGSCTIGGGGSPGGRENIIGGDGSLTVGTATPNTVTLGTGAHYSYIGGGYDNVAGGLASIINGFHNVTYVGTTHGFLGGGSFLKIKAGDYNGISCGTLQTIEGGTSYGYISGGGGNRINMPAGEDYGTINGGYNGLVTARFGTINGGNGGIVSGIYGQVSGGHLGKAAGAYSGVSAGDRVTAGGTASFGAGGGEIVLSVIAARSDYAGSLAGFQNNLGTVAPARFSGMLAGRSISIQAEYAASLAGRDCAVESTAEAAVVSGYGAVARIAGVRAHASGYFATPGDAQEEGVVARRQTTDATPAELRVGSTLGSRLLIPLNTTWGFSLILTARRTDADGERNSYEIKGQISRDGGVPTLDAGTVTPIHTTTPAWVVAVTADTVNGALKIEVTGEAAKTINWVATGVVTSVTG